MTSCITQLRLADLGATVVTGATGAGFRSRAEVERTGFRELPGYQGSQSWPFPMSLGECGCFLSHWMLWRHAVEAGLPAMFTFPAANGLQDWHFDIGSLRRNPPMADERFAVPADCATRACPKPLASGARGVLGGAVAA